MVKETIVTFLPFCERPKSDGPTMGNEMAVALDAASAALRNPCGVSTSSSCRRSPKGTPSRYGRVRATGMLPCMFHASLPLRIAVTCPSGIGVLPSSG